MVGAGTVNRADFTTLMCCLSIVFRKKICAKIPLLPGDIGVVGHYNGTMFNGTGVQNMKTEKLFKTVTRAQREESMQEFNYCCAACGCADLGHLDVDHVQPACWYEKRKIPVDNSRRNRQILCRACNNAKNGICGMAKLPPREPVDSCRENSRLRESVWRPICEAARAADPWAPLKL